MPAAERPPALPPKSPDSGKDPMIDAPPAPPRPAQTRAVGKKQLTVWLDADLHKRMSRLKVEEGMDLKEQTEAAIAAFLATKGY